MATREFNIDTIREGCNCRIYDLELQLKKEAEVYKKLSETNKSFFREMFGDFSTDITYARIEYDLHTNISLLRKIRKLSEDDHSSKTVILTHDEYTLIFPDEETF